MTLCLSMNNQFSFIYNTLENTKVFIDNTYYEIKLNKVDVR